jgi:hypothetical protein
MCFLYATAAEHESVQERDADRRNAENYVD